MTLTRLYNYNLVANSMRGLSSKELRKLKREVKNQIRLKKYQDQLYKRLDKKRERLVNLGIIPF